MKRTLKVFGIVAVSMLVYTCKVKTFSTEDEQASINRPVILNPSPAQLTPEESLRAFRVPKGYHMELVASEPMVKEPVAIAWDGDGKMYVAEMSTYMQDAEATGERQPISRIMLLEDTNGDGVMDKSSVFIDGLILPRMILTVGHELLVNETNSINITAYKDTDGDGKADSKRIVYQNDGYVPSDQNMEHQRSGLDWNLDNYIYITYDPVRFRWKDNMLKADTLISGTNGQWGVTHDNYGRMFYSNAGGENAGTAFQINQAYGQLNFPDQYDEETFGAVWSMIANMDAQGGAKRLRPDSTLNHVTSANGQSIYRGNRMPADMNGDYLIAEPVARIVRRANVINKEGKTYLENVYDKQEFIATTDFNFRPVNTYTGPDGAIYVVDMNRGIIQQATWTPKGSYIRPQIERLGLDKHIQHGRVWRLVHDNYKPGPMPKMLDLPASKLVAYLDHENGWWRDNAQKQIIVLNDKSVVPVLKQIARGEKGTLAKAPSALGRLHALWTLEGLESADKDVLFAAMKDSDAQVRRAAIWISEPYIKKNDLDVIAKVGALSADPSYDVRVQILESLYYSKTPEAQTITKRILDQNPNNEMLVATQAALQKNEDVRTYGSRLANMSVEDRTSILNGAAIFKALCAVCHGTDGKGLPTKAAPALVGSKRLLDEDPAVPIKILMHGLDGAIDGQTYTSIMPPMEANSNDWIADVLNYARHEFYVAPPRVAPPAGAAMPAPATAANGAAGAAPAVPRNFRRNGLPAIKPEEIQKVRTETKDRSTPWTLAELGLTTQL